MLAGDSAPRYKPDWQCVACSHVNFARRQACESCHNPRTADAPVAYAATHAAVQEGAVAPTQSAPFQRLAPRSPMQSSMRAGGLGLASMPMQVAHVPTVLMPGDWCCPRTTCGALNSAVNRSCQACFTPKDYQGPDSAIAFAAASGTMRAMPTQGAFGAARGFGGAGMQQFPPDWKCLSCDNINFARRTECKRCNAPRTADCPETHLGMEYKPDWRCTSCDNVNFARRTECKQCGRPRTADAPAAYAPSHAALKALSGTPNVPSAKPGDWQCGCGYLNFARRVECGKCNRPKPGSASIRYSPY